MKTLDGDLLKAADKSAFAALLADALVSVDAHGFSTKSENVKEIDNLIKHDYRLWDFDVRRIRPDVVLIVYKAHLKGTYKGEPFEDDLYASSEWVRRGGKWLQCLLPCDRSAKMKRSAPRWRTGPHPLGSQESAASF